MLLRHALAAMAGQHDHVVHVDQRPAGEGREAFDAVDQADGLRAVVGQHAEGLRPRRQRRRQAGQHLRAPAACRRRPGSRA